MAEKIMNRRADECPDAETIAVYLDRGLTAGGRASLATHMAGCETCYFVFTEAAQMRKTAAETETPTPKPDRLWHVLKRLRAAHGAWKATATAAGTPEPSVP